MEHLAKCVALLCQSIYCYKMKTGLGIELHERGEYIALENIVNWLLSWRLIFPVRITGFGRLPASQNPAPAHFLGSKIFSFLLINLSSSVAGMFDLPCSIGRVMWLLAAPRREKLVSNFQL